LLSGCHSVIEPDRCDDVRVMRAVAAAAGLAAALALTSAPVQAGTSSAAPAAATVKAERRLNALHCDAGRPDGRLDRHTRSAVIRFQSRTGLPQTGRLAQRTRTELYAEDAPRCDVRPVPARSGHGRRIVISQHQNWVWLVAASGRVVAQGGMADNTRVLHRGSHATGSYCGRAARIKRNQATSGGVWLDDFVRFAPCGIGFHRIPRSKASGRQIHADWLLGTDLAQSHGCIRLSRGLAHRVWDFTTRRTPVRVL
jgi:putative peptidoglycan binding protein/L,D-transpeptidase-like protein